jgi:hypothetical protein
VACEGTRPLVVELQALVSTTSYASPRRSATGIAVNRLHQILAVLEKHLGLPLSRFDCYLAVAGGLEVEEPAADLGVAAAVVASYRDLTLPPGTVLVGELGLGGQLRPVGQLELRLQEAARLGFSRAVLPSGSGLAQAAAGLGLELLEAGTVAARRFRWEALVDDRPVVTAAVNFAKAMGVSDLVIGLTIVAAGTSMPEVATSITAAIKGERDIAVGNVVGSNTFNILGCLGVSGLVSGSTGLVMAPSLLAFDIWVMLAVALACLPVFMTGREIARWEGGVFLGYYVAYVAYLILAAQQHDALQAFSGVMLGFVVPLTVVTLVVVMIRRPAAVGEPT